MRHKDTFSSCIIDYCDNLSSKVIIEEKETGNKVEISANDIIEFIGTAIKLKKISDISKMSASDILGL